MNGGFAWGFMSGALVVVALSVSGCGPSCVERGGHVVQHGVRLQSVATGKTVMLMTVPNYVCEGAVDAAP